jgi:hypothetical protein
MKAAWIKSLALAAVAVGYSHAIFGIGGQWAPAPGLAIKGSSGTVAGSGANAISINQGKVSGLNGFGVKLWVDALPFVDIEAGSNIQWGLYDVSISQGTDTTKLKFDLGVPTVNKPAFARIVSDVTVLYPFLKLPPLVPISILKVYAGAGITHVIATEILNQKLALKAVDKATNSGANPSAADTPEEVSKLLVKSIKDEGLKSGIGFHLELGAKAKIPIIPIAVYTDIKYHFLSSMPSAVDANSMTFELGGALAF